MASFPHKNVVKGVRIPEQDRISVVFHWFHFCFWIWSHVALKLPSKDTVNKRIPWNFPFKGKSLRIQVFQLWRQAEDDSGWCIMKFHEASCGNSSVTALHVSSERWNSLNVSGYCCSSQPSCKSNLLSSWLSLVFSPKSLSWREERMEFNFFASLSDFLSRRKASVYMAPRGLWAVTVQQKSMETLNFT